MKTTSSLCGTDHIIYSRRKYYCYHQIIKNIIQNNYGAIQPLIFSCRSFSLLKAIAKKKKERKIATTIAVAIVVRAITKWEAKQKRSK